MKDKTRITGTIKFVSWTISAVVIFYVVGYMHTHGYFDRWYYHSTDGDGYAVNADAFLDATKENPALLEIGDFKKIKGLQAVAVRAGGKLPDGTNGIITLDVLIDSKRARLKDAGISVFAPIDALDEEAKRLKEEKEKESKEVKEKQKGVEKDGYAANVEAVRSASPDNPVYLEITAGDRIEGTQAVEVVKGGQMPENANCIIGLGMLKDGAQASLEGRKIKVTSPFEVLKDDGGFAISDQSIAVASKDNPVELRITYNRDVKPGEAFPVKKGDILPLGVNRVIGKDVLLDGELAHLQPGRYVEVLVPWELKEAKGFKYKDTFKHKGIKTSPITAVCNLLIVVALGLSLGYMAEGFTDMVGIKLEKIEHFSGGH